MEVLKFAKLEEAQAKVKVLQGMKIHLSGNHYFKYLHVQFQAVVLDAKSKSATIHAVIHNFLSRYLTIHLLKMEDAKISDYLSHMFTCYLCEYKTLAAKRGRDGVVRKDPLTQLLEEHAFCNEMSLSVNVQPPTRLYGPNNTVESLVEMPDPPCTTTTVVDVATKEQLQSAQTTIVQLRKNVADANVAEGKAREEVKRIQEEKKTSVAECSKLKSELSMLQKEVERVKRELEVAKRAPPPVVTTIATTLSSSCETFSDFIQTRLNGNYALCSENPTYGYVLLRDIKRREEQRNRRTAATKNWNFEDYYHLEPLDQHSPVTEKQIIFLLRYNENKDYSLRRLNNHDDKVDGHVPSPSDGSHSGEEEEDDGEEEQPTLPPFKKSRNDAGLVDFLVNSDTYMEDDDGFFGSNNYTLMDGTLD